MGDQVDTQTAFFEVRPPGLDTTTVEERSVVQRRGSQVVVLWRQRSALPPGILRKCWVSCDIDTIVVSVPWAAVHTPPLNPLLSCSSFYRLCRFVSGAFWRLHPSRGQRSSAAEGFAV